MKTCSRCDTPKALNEFHRHPDNRDGRSGVCKVCQRERRLNPAFVGEPTTPIEVRARVRVAHALRSGRLVRPERCSECGRKCRPHAHHTNYNRPLDVTWLCSTCHAAEHPRPRNEKGRYH